MESRSRHLLYRKLKQHKMSIRLNVTMDAIIEFLLYCFYFLSIDIAGKV